ncbi:uncharacterized protein BDR25DRAFT_301255 [Lindgomyces ingoldianus]|uniref:Uncharacterized protein n=1 Tax=Lindgomyces ingoldianus TaxID=673940 RepID=A0ACB6R5X3_9PLEO|nr:uncharacterized protein BDR25DRAFT_301255 [Lindgomyces ingoldianus]KAF2474551.1 hypothetical protein BDR25DRAFT_301255 [Lindgomyces ingoldianus]
MGNTQSASHHHNRLSKPKTNTNSPFGTPKIDSPVSVSSKYADLSARERQALKSQLCSPIETEFSSSFASDADVGIGELATRLQARLSNLSRSNSRASQIKSGRASDTKLGSLPDSMLSLVSNTQSVDLETAIKILQEVRKNATPDDLAALHQALQPSAPSPSPAPRQSLDRRASAIKRSSSSLTRRRSLTATPGLATRGSPTDGTRKPWNSWQTPQVERQTQKWHLGLMGTSPLTRLAALDLAEDGRESPTPRAKTPGEMEYSHLGALQLGSLVVTNGVPSPAPSARKLPREKGDLVGSLEEDYFTASEGSSSPVKRVAPRNRTHTRSKSSALPVTPPLHRELFTKDRSFKTKSTWRCDSPLKLETESPYFYGITEVEPTKLRLQVINKSADTLAQDYMAELPDSPFVNRKRFSSEHQDEGFLDDDAISFREDALRILDGSIFSNHPQASQESKSTLESSHTAAVSHQKNGRPTPQKADSGYSSGGSFRVVQRAAKAMQEGTVPKTSKQGSVVADFQKSGHGSDSDDSVSLYTFEQMLALPISKKPLPPIPTDENVVGRPSHLRFSRTSMVHTHSPPPISPVTVTSIASQFTTDSGMSAQRRLQKRRPSSQNLPVVQSCQQVTEGSIPNIPVDVKAKFTRRLSESPGMEYLTQTYVSIEHIQSCESPVDSSLPIKIEFPSPSASPVSRSRRHTRSQTERSPTPPPHGIRRSFSFFRHKSGAEKTPESAQDIDNTALSVVDLGTVASTLGRSPYDAAMGNIPQKIMASPTHPHQLGNTLPRAKSMASMDARTATEVARIRSKDRALLRAEMLQRPKSYHDLNLEAGEATASRRRPHSVYSDIPPVPSFGVTEAEHISNPSVEIDQGLTMADTRSGPSIRARSTGRGPIVSQLVDRFDQYGNIHHPSHTSGKPDWEPHTRFWSQRRNSIGEGVRQHVPTSQPMPPTQDQRASSQPPEDAVYDRYRGGLEYGYERGFGIGGSAGTRQLHSAASRKSMHFSNQFGVDLSDVPVFLQRV